MLEFVKVSFCELEVLSFHLPAYLHLYVALLGEDIWPGHTRDQIAS